MKINKNEGILFWITGISGSGKTTIGKKIHKEIKKKYGPTVMISGDDLRNIFQIKKYDFNDRKKIAKNYSKFCKYLVKNNINVIFATVSLFHEVHKKNKKIFKNYIEIFINCKINVVKKISKKKIYIKSEKNIWGNNLKPQYPIKPKITINNNFKKSINFLSKELLIKIDKALS